jgi:hypothetical protein
MHQLIFVVVAAGRAVIKGPDPPAMSLDAAISAVIAGNVISLGPQIIAWI